MCFRSCSKLKISKYLGICSFRPVDAHFVQFMQFPVLHFGLAHSGSRPFNYCLEFHTRTCTTSCLQLHQSLEAGREERRARARGELTTETGESIIEEQEYTDITLLKQVRLDSEEKNGILPELFV